MRLTLATLMILAPVVSFAAGGSSTTPPKQTDTTKFCEAGFVFDTRTNTCIKTEQSSQLSPDAQMQAVRELAYAGRYDDAAQVLALMDGTDDMVLTYKGFVARKTGDVEGAQAYYAQAIAQNPSNILARSYRGQGYVAEGKIELARAELAEINALGGRETWAAWSLKDAIRSGQGYSY